MGRNGLARILILLSIASVAIGLTIAFMNEEIAWIGWLLLIPMVGFGTAAFYVFDTFDELYGFDKFLKVISAYPFGNVGVLFSFLVIYFFGGRY